MSRCVRMAPWPPGATVPTGNTFLQLHVEDTNDNIHGDMVFELFDDLAPETAAQITGRITDATDSVIPGATVQVKGTLVGGLTDLSGKYSIEVTQANATLVISFVGYVPKEVQVQNQTVVNVSLREDIQGLEEVVVVGYSTQKKSNLTGAVDQGGKTFADALSYAHLKPSFKGYNEFSTALQDELDSKVFNDNQLTAKAALDEITPQLQQLLGQ